LVTAAEQGVREAGATWGPRKEEATVGVTGAGDRGGHVGGGRADAQGAAGNPRAAMLTALLEAQRVALEAGDLEAARVAHEAVGRLLGAGDSARRGS